MAKVINLLKYFAYAVLVSATALLALYIYWALESPAVLDFKDKNVKATIVDNALVYREIPIRPSVVHNNEAVFMRLNYCKLKSVHGDVIARLVGEKFIRRITWPQDDNTKESCTNLEVSIPIPENSEDDKYHVEFQVDYHVNPLKTTRIILQSKTFEVRS